MKAWWRAFGLGSTGLMLLGALETTTVRIAAQPTKPIYLLDPLYELELNSEKRAIAGLDLTTVPKNVCVNRAPAVDVLNPFGGADGPAATNLAVRVDQELAINGHIEDDGLRAAAR